MVFVVDHGVPDLKIGPLDVRLLGDNLPVGAGSEYEVACQTSGSRPPATLTWWKSGVPLHLPAKEVSSIEGNVTTSTVRLRPGKADHGAKLSCRATNPRVPNKALEASWTLDVHFVPEIEVVLVSPEDSTMVKEGMAVSLECRVRANPPAEKITWLHNGNPVQTGMDYQVFSNNSLILFFVTRKNSGDYTCWALNTEGEARSPPFNLDVKYTPKCKSTKQLLYGASRHEAANVSCETTGNPQPRKFWWRYNSSVEGRDDVFMTNGSAGVSTTRVSLSGSEGEVSLLCWGENDVGNQSIPCSFRVVLANNPETPSNCSLTDRGETWVAIQCLAGSDGGLPQTFVAEVSVEGRLVANTSRSGTAEFTVTSLEPGVTYGVAVRAHNQKGSSETITFQAATTGRLITQRRTTSSESSSGNVDSTLLLGIISFVSCILAVGALVGAVLLCRRLHQRSPQLSPEQKKIEQMTVAESCTLSDDDRNPDVVPCSNEMTVLEVKGEVPLKETLMWESQLVLNSVPVHLANTQTVPCMQTWGVVGWEGSCPNIAQRHAETQTPQNVLESVV
ncbi:hypothetical protein J6590_072891 [Homalodisca vitripennis]|nr:hypothetical protein J6590_072891 [Homalodisca vitripennis]